MKSVHTPSDVIVVVFTVIGVDDVVVSAAAVDNFGFTSKQIRQVNESIKTDLSALQALRYEFLLVKQFGF